MILPIWTLSTLLFLLAAAYSTGPLDSGSNSTSTSLQLFQPHSVEEESSNTHRATHVRVKRWGLGMSPYLGGGCCSAYGPISPMCCPMMGGLGLGGLGGMGMGIGYGGYGGLGGMGVRD